MTTAQPVCDLPGLDPAAYDRWRASTTGAITERLERALILDLLGDVNGLRVLDVGCGDGDLAADLARRGAHVTGVDASPAMIEAARDKASREGLDMEFLVATAQNLPFPPGHFDSVAAVTILCFVKDAQPVFQDIARVLCPGGRVVIGELGKWSTWASARRVRAWFGSRLWHKGYFRTPGELRNLAEGAGLTPLSVTGAVYYPRCGVAARLLSPIDRLFGRLSPFGAAFLALDARKAQDIR